MKKQVWLFATLLVLAALPASTLGVQAAPPSPFLGQWQATDADGSDLGLSIGGSPADPFHITMTDNYISFCGGGPGTISGYGQLNAEDPYMLEAVLHLTCLTTADSLDFQYSLSYDSLTNTLIGTDEFGTVTPWHRPGSPAPSDAEGFIINPLGWDGSEFWLRPSDDVMLRWGWVVCAIGQAQAFINAVDVDISLDGQSLEGEWSIPEETPESADGCIGDGQFGWTTYWAYFLGHMEPGDHTLLTTVTLLRQVTDGFDLNDDGKPDQHSGTLTEEMEITIHVAMPIIVASAAGDWMWTSDFAPWSEVSATIYESQESRMSEEPPIWSGTAETNEDGFASLAFEGVDVVPGNVLTVSDGITQKELRFENFTIDTFDFQLGVIGGTAPASTEILVVASISPDDEDQKRIDTVSGADGLWSADFSATFGVTFTPEWLPWSFAQIHDEDGDANEAVTPPPMTLRINYGQDEWVESFYEEGHEVFVRVTDSDGVEKGTAVASTGPRDDWGGEPGFSTLDAGWYGDTPDLQPYDWVYAEVDNGITAEVQLGEILGEVFISDDHIEGTIEAPWISEDVQVECLDWGSGGDAGSQEAGPIAPDGTATYSCGWDPSVWDIQPWQNIGVGYTTPDGHWVANAFRAEHWVAMWTFDPGPGILEDGGFNYAFNWSYSEPEPGYSEVTGPITVEVSSEASIYDGYVLLRTDVAAPLLAWTGSSCETVTAVNPEQSVLFTLRWVNDTSMSEEEALGHFDSFDVDVTWDGPAAGSGSLSMGDLVEWYGAETSIAYWCSLTGN